MGWITADAQDRDPYAYAGDVPAKSLTPEVMADLRAQPLDVAAWEAVKPAKVNIVRHFEWEGGENILALYHLGNGEIRITQTLRQGGYWEPESDVYVGRHRDDVLRSLAIEV